MSLGETTLQAAATAFLSSFADSISAPHATKTSPSLTVPAGAWAIVLGTYDGGDAGDDVAISDSGSHTWTAIHDYDTTSRFGVWGWHNAGSDVSFTVTMDVTFLFNGLTGWWIGAITDADSATPSVAATLSNASTAEATATPTQVGSLFCLHYLQRNPTADLSSFDSGSAVDTSPASTAYFSGGPFSTGTVHRTSLSADTSTSLTVGATAPTSAQTYGALIEYFPTATQQDALVVLTMPQANVLIHP